MKKKLIIIAILLMSIGFAIISTNLIINGTSTIGKSSFDVYFSGAEVDGIDKTNEVVKDKKNIEFTSKNLLFTDDTSALIYEVTNNSSNYDAKVSVSCTNPSTKITVEEVPKSLTVYAKTIETGSIVVTLNEMAVDPEDVVITCTLNVNAEERTSLATDEIVVGSYKISGTLVDNNNNSIPNQYLAIYSETKKIVKTDSNGFFYIGNLERGIHEIYLINESDKDLSDTEIKEKPKGVTSTNKNETIILSNNYKIKNTNIDTTTVMYLLTFDTKDESTPNQTKYIRKGSEYGTLPTLEKEHYTFGGWYTSDTLQDETTKIGSTDVFNLDGDQTLYPRWKKMTVWSIKDENKNNKVDIDDQISLNIDNVEHSFHIYRDETINNVEYWWALRDDALDKGTYKTYYSYNSSPIKSYVDNYMAILNDNGANIQDATLITIEDLFMYFDCTGNIENQVTGPCVTEKRYFYIGKEWWTKSTFSDYRVWGVTSENVTYGLHTECAYYVRPIIKLLKSELE